MTTIKQSLQKKWHHLFFWRGDLMLPFRFERAASSAGRRASGYAFIYLCLDSADQGIGQFWNSKKKGGENHD
jgi:hypothetical protein